MPIPSGGLVTKLDFSDPSCYPGSGTVVYDLVGNNDFDVLNSPTFVSDGQKSYFQFAANTNKLQTATPVDVTSQTVFTFSVWAMSTGGSSAIQVVFGSGQNDPSGGVPHVVLNVAGSNVVSSTYGYGVGTAVGTAINQNQWYLLTMTCDGTTNKIYINGTLAGSGPRGTGSIFNDPTNFVIGQYSDSDFSVPWIGRVGAYYYYNIAITASDVENLYNSTYLRFSGTQIASYDFSNSACYPGSGSTVYDLVGSLDLPISGATFGGSGQAKYFSFDGNADYIGKTGVSGVGNTFTANIWYQLDVVNSTGRQLWQVGVNSASGTNPGFYLNYPSTSDLNYGFSFGVGTTTATGVLSANTWQMATVTADGTTTKIYVDGVLAGSVSQGIGTWATGGFAIGAGVDGSGNISAGADGLLGKVAILDIYNVALGSTAVTNLYNSESFRFDNLVLSYDFSDAACYPGTGNTVYDISGSDIDLPINGATFGGTGQSKYFSFDGSNDYIGKNGITGLGTTFSVNTWFKYPSGSSTIYLYSTGTYNAGQGDGIQSGIDRNTNTIDSSFNDGIGANSASVTTDTWQNLTVTNDGTTTKLYINGTLQDSASQGNGSWENGGLYLGVPISTGGNYFPGFYYLGDIAIWQSYNTALSSGDVTTLYNNQSTRFGVAPPPGYQGIVGGRQFAQGFNG